MRNHENLICWEIFDVSDPRLAEVKKLYELTQAPDERIPWEWLERSVERRRSWQPGRWCPHLLVSASRVDGAEPGPANGFLYGGHIPDYGGYVCYMGVDPKARKQGAGTRLFEQFFRVAAVDAGEEGGPLPCVVWESHRPAADASPEAWTLWTARLRLFARLGSSWIDGIDFHSPNYEDEEEPPLPFQLFVKPIDLPPEAFDAERLKGIAAGLHEKIYRHGPEHPLVLETLPTGCKPRLRPPLAAERRALSIS